MSIGYVLQTYLGAVGALLPAYYVWRLWRRGYGRLGEWLAELATTLALLAFVFVAWRWDIVGLSLRLWVCGLLAVAAVASVLRLPDLGQRKRHQSVWRLVFEPAIVLAAVAWSLSGYAIATPTLNLAPPVRGGTYYVVHGGGNAALNYHGVFASSQRYALDLTRLGQNGRRASGIYPRELNSYEAFGDTVFAPFAGTIVSVEGSLPDQKPSQTRLNRQYGNHVWIARGDTAVALAHMKQGSVVVRLGQRVQVGEPLGQIGNTGSTSEPHLHLHAVATDEPATLSNADSLTRAGRAIPLRIDGRFLVRNDTLR